MQAKQRRGACFCSTRGLTASDNPPACHHHPRRREGHPYEITKAQGAAPGRGAANAASPARQRRNLDACEKNCGCRRGRGSGGGGCDRTWRTDRRAGQAAWNGARGARKRVGEGTRVSVRVERGGCRIIKNKTRNSKQDTLTT